MPKRPEGGIAIHETDPRPATLVLDQEDVRRLLPMEVCIRAMEAAFRDLAAGGAEAPLRTILWLPDRSGALGVMPAAWAARRVLGVKSVSFFPGNEGTELDSHQGVVLLFEGRRGTLRAIVDGTSVTAVRTAAVSGLATHLLAREDASSLALVGSGVQAAHHLQAMRCVRDIHEVRVASRTLEAARDFARRMERRHRVPVRACENVEAAVRGADIVCTCTTSRTPVVRGTWLAEGCHVNAVGSSVPWARELDGEALRRARVWVDYEPSARREAGDIVMALEEGSLGGDPILGDLPALLSGRVPGRGDPGEITVFKSVGLALEDVAAALEVVGRAESEGAGRTVRIGGLRDEGP